MAKKLTSILCFILVISLLFIGCSSGSKENTGKDADNITSTVEEPTITQPIDVDTDGAEGEGTVDNYPYVQELNIIEDNYRNYYEIFVYSFCDSDGDGIGDMQGIISKLDYISEMGFNGIWLMPIMPSPTY
ncbi:MAG: hypothetical protein K0R92_3179, partial [Lachnospiraceae bacterium]|nr:hypothetical protein [Lachnospiraceae bacterium]